ncbi:DUF6588 family protein [Bacteroidota bacterium]
MRKYLTTLIFLMSGILFFNISNLNAQNLDETLDNLSSTAAQAYVAPVISAFGSNLNSGWVSAVPSELIGFTLRIKVVGVGSFFNDDSKRFSTSGDFRFTSSQVDRILQNETSLSPGSLEYLAIKDFILDRDWTVNMSGPTIVGSGDENFRAVFPGTTLSGAQFGSMDGEQIGEYAVEIEEVTGFLDELPALPQVAAQVTLGTVMGTNVAIRWFPDIEIQDLGKFSFFGIGFIHNPSSWLNVPVPVDVGIGYFYQSMKVGDLFESSASQYGIFASKKFGMGISVTPYLGLTLETSETTLSYTYQFDTPAGPQDTDFTLDLEGENSFGTTVGVAFQLAVINLFVDYKMAKTSTLSAGLWFGF